MKPRELTVRGLILGALITTVFTAANIYLGLKVGLAFASSIPAAVISMAILSAVKDSTILENNIVQTVASAAGTLSAIIFVLPGLVIVGWWTEFPFWQSFFICLSGGVLGVLFTIPLRRALVTTSDLPYPEGVAAAEVLKVGSGTRGETKDETGEAREGLIAVIYGSVASAGLAIVTSTRIAAAGLGGFIRLGENASTGYNFAWSLALLGAGHLVGLSVGMAMLVGQIISWVIAVPWLTSMQPAGVGETLAAHTTMIWRTQVRFIGAGTISGVGILSIVICASLITLAVTPTVDNRQALVAFALFVTAIVFACATISNDNLQDLKTGQLVGASPMRQQIALIVGVAAGASVIPFVLNLLTHAYGFAGAANVGVVAPNPLPAPQATLISALAQGVIGGSLDWKMIGIGALVGVGLILLDIALGAMKKLRIPPLAVGIGIYLPMSATFAVVVGAVISHWYNRRTRSLANPERAERLGTLVASGLIVGESLWGVINAGLIVGLSNDAPIGLVSDSFALGPWLGLLGVVGVIISLYGWMLRRSAAVR